MRIENKLVSRLESELAAINAERDQLREKAKAKKRELDEALADEQADYWGVSREEYAAAKAAAKERGQPLHVSLKGAARDARARAREAQSVTAQAAAVGVKSKGV